MLKGNKVLLMSKPLCIESQYRPRNWFAIDSTHGFRVCA